MYVSVESLRERATTQYDNSRRLGSAQRGRSSSATGARVVVLTYHASVLRPNHDRPLYVAYDPSDPPDMAVMQSHDLVGALVRADTSRIHLDSESSTSTQWVDISGGQPGISGTWFGRPRHVRSASGSISTRSTHYAIVSPSRRLWARLLRLHDHLAWYLGSAHSFRRRAHSCRGLADAFSALSDYSNEILLIHVCTLSSFSEAHLTFIFYTQGTGRQDRSVQIRFQDPSRVVSTVCNAVIRLHYFILYAVGSLGQYLLLMTLCNVTFRYITAFCHVLWRIWTLTLCMYLINRP